MDTKIYNRLMWWEYILIVSGGLFILTIVTKVFTEAYEASFWEKTTLAIAVILLLTCIIWPVCRLSKVGSLFRVHQVIFLFLYVVALGLIMKLLPFFESYTAINTLILVSLFSTGLGIALLARNLFIEKNFSVLNAALVITLQAPIILYLSEYVVF